MFFSKVFHKIKDTDFENSSSCVNCLYTVYTELFNEYSRKSESGSSAQDKAIRHFMKYGFKELLTACIRGDIKSIQDRSEMVRVITIPENIISDLIYKLRSLSAISDEERKMFSDLTSTAVGSLIDKVLD